MAKTDYFCCEMCDNKTVYDGHSRIADELAWGFGIQDDDIWKIVVICNDCTEDGSIRFYSEKSKYMKRK